MDNLQHVGVVVSSIEEAVIWYRSLFDLEVTYADKSWALVRGANISMGIGLARPIPIPHRDRAQQPGLLCIAVMGHGQHILRTHGVILSKL